MAIGHWLSGVGYRASGDRFGLCLGLDLGFWSCGKIKVWSRGAVEVWKYGAVKLWSIAIESEQSK